jgi:hypothetical protein
MKLATLAGLARSGQLGLLRSMMRELATAPGAG